MKRKIVAIMISALMVFQYASPAMTEELYTGADIASDDIILEEETNEQQDTFILTDDNNSSPEEVPLIQEGLPEEVPLIGEDLPEDEPVSQEPLPEEGELEEAAEVYLSESGEDFAEFPEIIEVETAAEGEDPDTGVLPEDDLFPEEIVEDASDNYYAQLVGESYDPSGLFPVQDDERFYGYVQQAYYNRTQPVESGKTAGKRLTGLNRILYDHLFTDVSKVASGEIESTIFEISIDDMGMEQTSWTASELGIDSIVSNNAISKEAVTAVRKKGEYDLGIIVRALLADCPYSLYWYDKTSTMGSTGFKLSAVYDSAIGEYKIGFVGSLLFYFPVALEYSVGEYIFNTEIGRSVQPIVDTAADIIGRYAGVSDYEKLRGYRKEICDLVSYNFDAAEGGMDYGNPWQLIWVFDGDPSTNVVCEGYSKAFRYLCSLTDFAGEISCIIVTGTMGGGTGEGPHMWNIVTMEDGKNYLVDVTNCDEGSIGADEFLFMTSRQEADIEGSPANGYTYVISGNLIRYIYDEETFSLYSEDDLILSETGYQQEPIITITPTPELPDDDYDPNEIILSGECGDQVTYTLTKGGVLTVSGTGDMWNYWSSNLIARDNKPAVKKIIIEDGVTSIGEAAFSGYLLVEDLVISDSVKVIGENAFTTCTNLLHLDIPDGVEKIGAQAFHMCTGLKTVAIGSNVSEIGDFAFAITTDLREFTVKEENPYFSVIDGVLFDKAGKVLVSYPCKHGNNYSVPDGVTTIAASAFDHSYVRRVELPDSVRTIEPYAFSFCEFMIQMAMKKGIEVIGDYAFSNCAVLREAVYYGSEAEWSGINIGDENDCLLNALQFSESDEIHEDGGSCGTKAKWSLKADGTLTISGSGQMDDWGEGGAPWSKYANRIDTLVIESGITSVGNHAFEACRKIGEVTIPDSVITLGDSCFDDCSGLALIHLGSGLKTIGYRAFWSCSSLKELTIPDSVETIGGSAIVDCRSLRTLNIGSGVSSIDYGFGMSSLDRFGFAGLASLEKVTVDTKNRYYKDIDGVLFSKDGTMLILYPNRKGDTYTIPDGVTSIELFAFRECEDLTHVSIPDSVQLISMAAFWHCINLEKVDMGKNVNAIESWAFAECIKLKEMVIPAGVTDLNRYTFFGDSNLEKISLPENLRTVGREAFEGCRSIRNILLPETVLYIEKGAFNECNRLESIVLPAELKELGEQAFSGCHSLKEITVPEGIEYIGTETFCQCYNLQKAALPSSLTGIGERAFIECNSLEEIIIPDTVTDIGSYAFYFCNTLTEVTIPDKVSVIEEGAFEHCNALKDVRFPEGLKEIRAYAFWGDALENINIPEGVYFIGEQAFRENANLARITLPSSLQSLGYRAFFACTQMSEIVLPSSLQTIGEAAFEECGSLSNIVFVGDPEEWNGISIGEGNEPLSDQDVTFIGVQDLCNVDGHVFGEWEIVEEPTVLKKGKKKRICSRCNTEEEEMIPELTGTLELSDYEISLAPGESAMVICRKLAEGDGIKSWTSSDESIAIVDEKGIITGVSAGSAVITVSLASRVAGEVSVVVLNEKEYCKRYGHTVEQVQGTEPDCTKTGLTEGSRCSVCGEVIKAQEIIPATGHKWGEWKTIKEPSALEAGLEERKCEKCGEKEEREIEKTLFADVTDPEQFFFDPIYWAVNLGITTGFPEDNTFRPNNSCNRAAVVTFLWRLAGKPDMGVTEAFSDMTGNSDFDHAITWAAAKGITTGYKDGTFRPWAICNRAAIVTFLWRYAGRPEPTSMAEFSDMTANDDFDKAISWAAEKGITTGYENGTFRPWNQCARLAVVTFLYRYSHQ